MIQKIIKNFAQTVLGPLGFEQLKESRMWVLDKGYYLIVVNFESSGSRKGTYIDAGLHFLWNPKDYISYDFFYGLSPRVVDFIEYQNDVQFQKTLEDKSETTSNVVSTCIKLNDLKELAKLMNGSENDIENGSWSVFHKAVLEGLSGNVESAKSLFEGLIISDESSDILWRKERAIKTKKYQNILDKSVSEFTILIKQETVKSRELLGIGAARVVSF